MKINLSNPAHIKLLLLSQGVRFLDDDLKLVGSRYSENRYYYNVSNQVEEFTNKIPSEILLPQDIESSIYYNPNSELEIKYDGRNFGIFWEDTFLFKIDFNHRPSFFDKPIGKNLLCQQAVSMYGRYVLGIFSNAFCFFFGRGEQCKFCSLQPSRQTLGADNLPLITPSIITEAIIVALKHEAARIKYIMYTCGTHIDPDASYQEQSNIIASVKKLFPKIGAHHLTIMPTKNEQSLIALKTAGLDSIAFDLEVFDKEMFKEYCPGKEKYFGYDSFFETFKLAKNIFGHSQVKVGFVGGLEPVESLAEGMNFFGKMGISPAVNVFHPDIGSDFSDKERPTVDYLLQMAKYQSKVYKTYSLEPVFPVGGRRSSLDTEIYRNFFD